MKGAADSSFSFNFLLSQTILTLLVTPLQLLVKSKNLISRSHWCISMHLFEYLFVGLAFNFEIQLFFFSKQWFSSELECESTTEHHKHHFQPSPSEASIILY